MEKSDKSFQITSYFISKAQTASPENMGNENIKIEGKKRNPNRHVSPEKYECLFPGLQAGYAM